MTQFLLEGESLTLKVDTGEKHFSYFQNES